MADQKHLSILQQGVEVWNHWRRDNPEIKPDLKDADLRSAILRLATMKGINFSEANLKQADLKGADLWNANLKGANLDAADLRGANLWGADLSHTQALLSNFSGSILTGVCILNWKINPDTNFNHVVCKYVYLKANQQNRHPGDLHQNFAPGDFGQWVQQTSTLFKVIKTASLS